MKNIAIYIHWPFCKSKCPYCDFNSHVSNAINPKQWHDSYLREIDYFDGYLKNKQITSIFFGGGTPTLMPPIIAESIINKFARNYSLAKDAEITLEGNPTSVEADKLRDFKEAGVNRVSLGVQSLNGDDLKFLGREHSKSEALRAVEQAAAIFDNYSFDLIYCRPDQTISNWEKELNEAMQFVGKHLSLYQLTIEKGTPFYSAYNKGAFEIPDNDLAAEFYEFTNGYMQNENMPAYEVSNYAVQGFESKHNMTYWRYGDYLGIGPGAHSRITQGGEKISQMMIHNPDGWLKSVDENSHGIQTKLQLSSQEVIEEIVMMGMRIKEGISKDDFKAITSKNIDEVLQNIQMLEHEGLVANTKSHLKITDKGIMLVNSVAAKLLELSD